MIFVLPIILLLLLLGAVFGGLHRQARGDPSVQALPLPATGQGTAGTLFVLVHGLDPVDVLWQDMARTLQPHGAVLRLKYDAGLLSNADPLVVAKHMAQQIEAAVAQHPPERVVLVAHSMGALLARKALLLAHEDKLTWPAKVKRAVLLAGVNRGWDVAGEPAADMNGFYRFAQRVLYWGADFLGTSRLVFDFERGQPFVANLRLDWMRWMRNLKESEQIEVVQLLGDIDDVVSRRDNEDLRVIATGRFSQLQLRGTGHGDIINFHTGSADAAEARLGDYRRGKLLLAATGPFKDVLVQNEAQPYTTDDDIEEVVFVLHGIRDLGRWSANFEAAINSRYGARRETIAIVSSRYGYFGMGPFLFEGVRQRYVRWFMDEYTEALARYPNLKPEKIHFFGHSNGSYIAAEALRQYTSMRIERVVLAGSVLPQAFPWDAEVGDRVKMLRNYVGTEDWVVALFPRLFELPLVKCLGNGLGSAGFNGFLPQSRVTNVKFVEGAHGAFESRVEEIVDYLLAPGTPAEAKLEPRGAAGKVLAFTPLLLAVWAGLAALVMFIGVRVVAASPSPSWPVLLLYALLVVTVLRTV